MTASAERAALTAFPQLQDLLDLRIAGWRFLPVTSDGTVVELRGAKLWPLGWVDALALRDLHDAAGLRRDPAGAVVWWHDGSLAEVVDALLALPVPRPWSR